MDRLALHEMLLRMLEEETGEAYPSLQDADSLIEDLGLDSVDFVSLVLHIENRFRIKLATDDLHSLRTVGELLDLIEDRMRGSSQAA